MKTIRWWVAGVMLAGATLRAQTYNIIYNFTNDMAGVPYGGVVLSGNTLYGTATWRDGEEGTVYKVNMDGTGFSVLAGSGGFSSMALNGNRLFVMTTISLLMAYTDATNVTLLATAGYSKTTSDLVTLGNTLYGATGSSDDAIFGFNTESKSYSTVTNLSGSEGGSVPCAGLAVSGNTFYGTTYETPNQGGSGTIFKINADGSGYAILHTFKNTPDGANPTARLVLNGSLLYGTTMYGGSAGAGTVFVIATNGSGYAVLKNFTNSPDGANPQAGLLVQGNMVYGTTVNGGSAGEGTVFEMTTNGSGYVTLHNFTDSPDGAYPTGNLITGNGALIGTTSGGGTIRGANGVRGGTIFELTPPPPQLQLAVASNSPLVLWPNDGFSHTLLTTTNLNSGPWTTVPNGVPQIGLQLTNATSQPQAFFRLQ